MKTVSRYIQEKIANSSARGISIVKATDEIRTLKGAMYFDDVVPKLGKSTGKNGLQAVSETLSQTNPEVYAKRAANTEYWTKSRF